MKSYIALMLGMGASLAMAEPEYTERDYHRERAIVVGPVFSATNIDNERNISDNPGTTGLMAGYNVTRHWSVIGTAHRSRSLKASPERIRFSTLGLTYNVLPASRISPYIGLSAGRVEFEDFSADDSSVFDVNAGVYLFARRSIAFRLNYDYLVGYHDHTNDALYGVSVVALLGGHPDVEPTRTFDSDGDGVVDSQDQCPNTRPGAVVDENGCEIEQPPEPPEPPPPSDVDNDGVPDDTDYCPDSPAGASVDQYGCEMLVGLTQEATLYGVTFPKGGIALDSTAKQGLDRIAEAIKAKPYVSIELEGHADDRAKAGISRNVAKKRADVAAQYLVDRGVDGRKIVSLGFGETQPIADNKKAEGRALNRRVLVTAWNTVEKQQRRCAENALPDGASQEGCKVLTPVADADGDSIADANDICPGSNKGAKVDVRGCVLGQQISGTDSDADGIADGVDYCPSSAKGATVDRLGCSTEDGNVERLLLKDLTFNSNSTNLNPSVAGVLDRAINRLKGRAFNQVIIEGHTDSTDSEGYNGWLSLRRSRAVRNYLALEGIPTQNIAILGFGEGQPIASNKTPEGRARNRRVIISIR